MMSALRFARLCGLTILLSILTTACGNQSLRALQTATLLPPTVSSSVTPLPTSTPSPPPTFTLTPSPTFSPTPTPHPLTIESMRARTYPGSEVRVEATLDPGRNYYQYLTSYQSEGLKIFALLTIPFGERPPTGWPVIIFNHGYIPPDQYRTTTRYVAYVDHLARNGYIVFKPDYRGHGESEGEARGAYGSPDYVIDVLNAVASMQQYPDADPNRIGMWGHSMGGYITLRSMVVGEDVKAGVIWAGVVASYPDLIARWRRNTATAEIVTRTPFPGRRWRTELSEMYGSPEENPEFWDSISANSYLTDLSGPLQLHHGTGDTSVPVEFSETLFQQTLAVEKMVELYLYQDADHNLSSAFSLAMQRTIQFFDRYLKDL